MKSEYIKIIAQKLSLTSKQVSNTLQLFEEGATVPFISRYRKEATGSLNEVSIVQIKELGETFVTLEKRKEFILKTLEQQEKLSPELRQSIENCYEETALEDLYLPYKQKKKTRASKAKEKGLQPLAEFIFQQTPARLQAEVSRYINDSVPEAEDALQGARDIIAEMISNDKKARESLRREFDKNAIVESKVVKNKKEEAEKYADYFAYSEPLKHIPSHRFLAIMRGLSEGYLRMKLQPDSEQALQKLKRIYVKGNSDSSEQVSQALEDAYQRLLLPAIENEYTKLAKAKADKEAIDVFSKNLRQLLLAPPLGEKRILAIDPAYKTGCKLVCLDELGNLLHNETIFPHPPRKETFQSAKKLTTLTNTYEIEAIAIGNGTASRETEQFVKQKVRFERDIDIFVVSEDGASVYSASAVAREEFPDYDVTVRGAVSIGRRLADPLAELVKIDPKSIGVGQYQHDVNPNQLQKGLDLVVESCVNSVGVDLNTAGKELLTYVSGLGPRLAQNIVNYRKEHGAFSSREELLKIPGLGSKVFEQCAGFLRIKNGDNPLDNTAVHPESYSIVNRMAEANKVDTETFIKNKNLRQNIDPEKYINDNVGLPTLTDIMAELDKPGRDPREKAQVFEFSKEVFSIEDLKIGSVLPGIVTNITNFGAFVDVGVKQDGLVHISHLANRFVKNPADVVHLHQHVQVKVLDVDISRKRISLSMKDINK